MEGGRLCGAAGLEGVGLFPVLEAKVFCRELDGINLCVEELFTMPMPVVADANNSFFAFILPQTLAILC